jgi:hypothetical protein
VPLVDGGNDVTFARPQHNLAAGMAHGLRKSGAPGAAANDTDAVDVHARSPPLIFPEDI